MESVILIVTIILMCIHNPKSSLFLYIHFIIELNSVAFNLSARMAIKRSSIPAATKISLSTAHYCCNCITHALFDIQVLS
jgi:hypothetical protein